MLARAHTHEVLCGAAWVNSKAKGKDAMFMESSGKISTVCSHKTSRSRFSPQSHKELQEGIADCLRVSSVGDCSTSVHSSIRDWNVSAVTDMVKMFHNATEFNADISRWNVSAVTDMRGMFAYAKTFNTDISEWDVSAVTNMKRMFYGAGSFNANISKWDVSAVTDMTHMFLRSSSFDQVVCT